MPAPPATVSAPVTVEVALTVEGMLRLLPLPLRITCAGLAPTVETTVYVPACATVSTVPCVFCNLADTVLEPTFFTNNPFA